MTSLSSPHHWKMLKALSTKVSAKIENSASAIILPGGEVDNQLIMLIQHWTESWLLKPAFWISINDVVKRDSQTPKILATVIGRNGMQQVDLLQYLSGVSLDCLNLIAVRVVEEDSSHNIAQDEIVDTVSEYVERSKPANYGPEVDGKFLQLIKVNLVFAPTERSGVSANDLYEPNWDFNLIVSPEDRRAPSRLDGFLRYSEGARLNSFMLMNIASAAGIWLGQRKGIFEIVADEKDHSVAYGKVRLMRVFVRGILSEGLSIRVAAEALRRAADAQASRIKPRAFENPQLQALEEHQIDGRIDQMVSSVFELDNQKLEYVSPSLEPNFNQNEIGVLGGLKKFIYDSWNLLKVLPIWIFAAFWNAIAKLVTLRLFGDRGRQVAKGTIDFPQTDLDTKNHAIIEEISSRRDRITELLESLSTTSLRTSAPRLWKGLRNIMVGNTDGSALPDEISIKQPETGPKLVLGDLNLVLPSLADQWSLPAHIERSIETEPRSATWQEMEKLANIEEFLTSRISISDELLQEALTEKQSIDEELSSIERELASLSKMIDRGNRGLPIGEQND